MRTLAGSLGVITVCLSAGSAFGGGSIYRYTEKDGTVVYTNVPPSGIRAKRIRGAFHPSPKATEPAAPVPSPLSEYYLIIEQAATRYRIPVALVHAIMHAESNFDPHAVSERGASGLMQLMPDTAREMYVKDIFNVRDNIEGGTRYLRYLANEFQGDMVKMVAAYNAGPDAIKKYGGNIPPFDETQAYVRKVLQLYFQYKDLPKLAQADRP
jgi:soluble lytic murein transglycosylase-like protein